MREAGFFVQDSWRIRPDLTVNAGLRYELQFPFTPRNNSYSTATVESFCGVSGTNPDTLLQPVPAGHQAGRAPDVHQLRRRHAGLQHRLQQLGAERRGGLDAQRIVWAASGIIFGRNEGDSVLRGGFTKAFSREGMARFTGSVRRQPRRDDRG